MRFSRQRVHSVQRNLCLRAYSTPCRRCVPYAALFRHSSPSTGDARENAKGTRGGTQGRRSGAAALALSAARASQPARSLGAAVNGTGAGMHGAGRGRGAGRRNDRAGPGGRAERRRRRFSAPRRAPPRTSASPHGPSVPRSTGSAQGCLVNTEGRGMGAGRGNARAGRRQRRARKGGR